MKPRDGWKIADTGSSARRLDGVMAEFNLTNPAKPFVIQRRYTSTKRGRSVEYLRRAGSLKPMQFRTLHAAMTAADERWPLQ